ncbi:MAG: DUF3987 domain-containing protein [Planctomycetota bacterium]|nr:MAG: DUF3987 domain-containing protein [Planctomycetota bacterium]
MVRQDDGNMLEAARAYAARGFAVVPLRPKSKQPAIKNWQRRSLTEDELPGHFSGDGNIGIVLGEMSGGLVDIDLDCEEAVRLAPKFLPETGAIGGRGARPRSHWFYYCVGIPTARHNDPIAGDCIVEIRSTGSQTAVGPSIHPDGDAYERLEGEPAVVAPEVLAEAVRKLYEAVSVVRHGTLPQPLPPASPRHVNPPETTHAAVHDRAARYLDVMPAAISGEGGHNATYAAATALVHGFCLPEGEALELLESRFNPRCQPPWERSELEHKVRDAATKEHRMPYGWLKNASPCRATAITATVAPGGKWAIADPGPIPSDRLRVPGFVGELADATLAAAPYPNEVLATAGALALLSVLSGGIVRDRGDARTNLYVLAIGHSGIGKDAPRKMNAAILHRAGLSSWLAQQLGSGEGLQDALQAHPNLLVQTDEFDTMLEAMRRSKDGRFESLLALILSAYSSSNSVLPMRRLAGRSGGVIDQPHLVIFGTAIPNHYYAALSERTLTNGLFARMLVFEAGSRGVGQDAGLLEPPDRVVETACWWAGQHKARSGCRTPRLVETDPNARARLGDYRRYADQIYARAEQENDAVATAVWARAGEHAHKLALLYAVSENHEEPVIRADAAEWATGLVSHLVGRMLFMASEHTAESSFDDQAKRLVRKIRDRGGEIDHSTLLKRSKLDAATFKQVIETLEERGDIVKSTVQTEGRHAHRYALVQEGESAVNEGGG